MANPERPPSPLDMLRDPRVLVDTGLGPTVEVVRPPSDGEYLAFEDRVFPRATTWDVLLERTGAPGIHFADFPQLVGLELPEWSHIAQPDAERFTAELYALLEREDWGQARVAARHDRR